MSNPARIVLLADFDREYLGGRSFVLGIDEAVCAGAVAVSAGLYSSVAALSSLRVLNDSKQLSREARESVYGELEKLKAAGLLDFEAAFAEVAEIEKLNILAATQIAMARAAGALNARLGLNLARAGAAATLFGESPLDISKAQVIIDGR